MLGDACRVNVTSCRGLLSAHTSLLSVLSLFLLMLYGSFCSLWYRSMCTVLDDIRISFIDEVGDPACAQVAPCALHRSFVHPYVLQLCALMALMALIYAATVCCNSVDRYVLQLCGSICAATLCIDMCCRNFSLLRMHASCYHVVMPWC